MWRADDNLSASKQASVASKQASKQASVARLRFFVNSFSVICFDIVTVYHTFFGVVRRFLGSCVGDSLV